MLCLETTAVTSEYSFIIPAVSRNISLRSALSYNNFRDIRTDLTSDISKMFSFRSFRDWVHQAINIILSYTILLWYAKIFRPTSFVAASTMSDSIIPLLPNEITTEILLKLPPKSLLKFTSVSKSWLQLISSPDFVKNHMKLTANDKGCSHHRVLFRRLKTNFKFCSFSSLFHKEQTIELLDMDSPVENPFFSTSVVGSVHGLICLFTQTREGFLWNPTTRKCKELPKLQVKLTWDTSSFYNFYGFGYDDSRDDYKILVIDYLGKISTLRTVVNIYSLRTDSWRTVDELQGIFLANYLGKFVNGKLYWVSSTGYSNHEVGNVISFDLANETWGKLELPICGEVDSHFKLGVVGSDLSLLYTCRLGVTTSDVWILKDCGANVSWTKLFTIEYPLNVVLYVYSPPTHTFSIQFRESNKGEILLLLPQVIMICDGSTRQLEVVDKFEKCTAVEIYVESLVDPVFIADQEPHNHGTSQSLS
ncbi:F-box/kelch-repeat protein At3g23880-like [Lycium barbarum]|uniref:F-box/kelch-repeat protein At3g23880-like n=1 Tax=Lycium barbarum TaxID=112863 RepID=UPI00293F0E48|nr:F-box/kelch-repeat protein At3g23880-like [Lycium barbarum]